MRLVEFINRIIRLLNRYIHSFVFSLITIIESFYLRCIGVNVGKQIKYRGWVSVFRSRNSTICIGSKCIFNSSGYTNHIGINHRCILTTMASGAKLIIGEKCGFSGCSITAFNEVIIGNNVRVGANCVIADGDFHLDDPRISNPKPINIGNNVWLGYGVVVMKGVTIGENTIIGLNSVVTKDIPSNCIAAGNPCIVKKYIDNV